MNESDVKRIKRQLELIEETVSTDIYNLGEQFFERIVLKLNEAVNADYTFVGKLHDNLKEVQTISIVNREGLIGNFNYELENTPCENVIGNSPCSYSKNVARLFPKDELLIEMGIEAYVGVPLFDSKKDATGIMVCLYKSEISNIKAIESLLLIFASRASAELEHMKLYHELEQHKEQLESKIQERTKELHQKNEELILANTELQRALEDLTQTKSQLFQAEKMASLGILTSGVAHEINNPLNYLSGSALALKKYFDTHDSQDKKKTDVILEGITTGVNRIADIVKGLNQFSRTNDCMDEDCELHSILDNCLTMLKNETKDRIRISKAYHYRSTIKGNSGKLHQVFLNILTNSVQAINTTGNINVTLEEESEYIAITIEDDGMGMDNKTLKKITDPFFTTKEPGSGTGLGLSIAQTIIDDHNGKLHFNSKPGEGTTVIVSFPITQ